MKKIVLVVLGLVAIFALAGCKDDFMKDYEQLDDRDHIFVEKTADEIFEAAENKEHFILYLGFPECPWCQSLVPVLNEAAKDMDKPEVWYYNIKEDRAALNETYLKMVELVGLQRPTVENGKVVGEHAGKNENGVAGVNRIAVPFTAVMNSGKIEYFPDISWPKNVDSKTGEEFDLFENDTDLVTVTKDGQVYMRVRDTKDVDGDGDKEEWKVLVAHMWSATKSEINDSADEKLKEEHQKRLKEALKKMLDYSECSSCNA